jgi:predicted amidohydrolase
VSQAAERGASLVALPELFNCLAQPGTIVSQAEPIPGPTSQAMSELAATCQVTLVAGSIGERSETNKIYNTSLLFGPDGAMLARYRKLHLFDIDLPGSVTFRESQFMASGDRVVVTQTAIGRLGQATCYDLRFPELFRLLVDGGAELLVIPAAFTMATGRDHWEVLLRARAIENQVYVVAPNQYGRHDKDLHTYGRSMIIDPWGTVLATASDGEGQITAETDFDRLSQIRSRLPSLLHRRNLDQLSSVSQGSR